MTTNKSFEKLLLENDNYLVQKYSKQKNCRNSLVIFKPTMEILGKRCLKYCGEHKRLSYFNKDDKGIAGRSSYCRECQSRYNEERKKLKEQKEKEEAMQLQLPVAPLTYKQIYLMFVNGELRTGDSFIRDDSEVVLTFDGSLLVDDMTLQPVLYSATKEGVNNLKAWNVYVPSRKYKTIITLTGDKIKQFELARKSTNQTRTEFIQQAVLTVLDDMQKNN